MLPKKLSTIEKKGLLELKQKLFEALPNQIDFVRLYGMVQKRGGTRPSNRTLTF